jgi:hypothetical protein
MITWSMAHLTDGKVPSRIAKIIATDDEIAKLVEVKLVHFLDDETLIIHDFLDWNDSAKEVRRKRESKRNAGKNGGLQKSANRKQVLAKSPSKIVAPASGLLERGAYPSPSPSPKEIKKEKEPAPIPEPSGVTLTPIRSDTPLTDEMREVAATIEMNTGYAPDIELEWAHFLSTCASNGYSTASLKDKWHSWLCVGAKKFKTRRNVLPEPIEPRPPVRAPRTPPAPSSAVPEEPNVPPPPGILAALAAAGQHFAMNDVSADIRCTPKPDLAKPAEPKEIRNVR